MESFRISALYTMCFILKVNALGTCKQSVVQNILSRNNCPRSVLSKLSKLSPFTYTINPNGSVPDYIKCTNGEIEAPNGDRSNALVTAYYKNSSREPAKIEYFHEDLGSGHIKEFDSANNVYEIYVMMYDIVFCYYRCTTYETEGADFGACAVSISQVNDAKAQEEIEECKNQLKAAGITGELVDLVACDSA